MLNSLNHVSQGLGRLTSVFDDSVKLRAFLSILLEEFNEIEEVLLTLSKQKDLDNITGVWLDYIGLIIGEPRSGREDEEYRQALQLKVSINKADGTTESIREIIIEYTRSDRVRIAKAKYLYGQIIFDGDTNADRTLWELVQKIKPVTTNLLLVQNTESKSFFPAWEDGVTGLELFNAVISEGASEGLELVLGDSSVVSMFVSLSGEQGKLDPDTEDDCFLEWEDPSEFEVFDGTTSSTFELQVSESEVSAFIAEGLEAAVLNETLLPWEINEDSYVNPFGLAGDYEFFDGVSVGDLYVQTTDTSQEKLQVVGVKNN